MSKVVALPRRGAVLAALLVLAIYPIFSMLWSKTFSSTPPRADSGPPPETAEEEPTGPLWWYPWGLGEYKLNPAPEFVDPPSAPPLPPPPPPPPPPPHSETLHPYVPPHQNNWDDDKALAKATEEADKAPPTTTTTTTTTTKGSYASSIKKNADQGFWYPWGKGNEDDHLEPPAASSSSLSSSSSSSSLSSSQSPAWCVEGSVGWSSPADLGRGACKPAIAANPDPVKRRCDPKTYQPARGEGDAASFVGQSREDRAVLNRYYCQKRNGTYVEVGALDGLRYSNTLFLEKALGWSGVLIEGQPDSAQLLARNRPGNHVIQKAVCPDGSRGTVRFYGGRKHTRAGIEEHLRPDAREGYASGNKPAYEVPCQPFHAMLAAAGFGRGGRRGSVIDFASVDIEGAEHIVLETMDYRIAVRVWLIELFEEDEESKKKAQVVASLLESHGYRRSPWDIREYCKQLDPTGPLRRVMTGRLCTANVMFEHPDLVH